MSSGLYLHTGFEVADASRERVRGEVLRIIRTGALVSESPFRVDPHCGEPLYVDVRWPDGAESRYGRTAARDSLTVTNEGLFDIFRLGVTL